MAAVANDAGFRLCLSGGCFFNVQHNVVAGPWAEKQLRIVVGSQAFHGHWEFGGPQYASLTEFRGQTARMIAEMPKPMRDALPPALRNLTGQMDAHAWLEDGEGRVYDYIFEQAHKASLQWTGKPLTVHGWVEGRTKAELRAEGIEYLAAPEALQSTILRTVQEERPLWQAVLRAGLAGGRVEDARLARLWRLIVLLHKQRKAEQGTWAAAYIKDDDWKRLVTNGEPWSQETALGE